MLRGSLQLVDAQEALSFLVSQTAYIEAEVYRTQYPDIQFRGLMAVDNSAPDWIKTITYFSSDQVGRADWFHSSAKDIPLADVHRTKHDTTIEMAAIGYRYTLEEISYAMLIPGMRLDSERAMAASRASEEFLEQVALYGDTTKNLPGLLNYPGITIVDAPTGTGGSTWDTKTADEIMADVNALLTGVYTASLTVEIADTLLLPVELLLLIATKRIGPDTAMTLLQYLRTNNAYSAVTGRPLNIRGVRGLEDAGVGGSGRIVAYRNAPDVVKFHLPMEHRFLEVWRTGPLVYDVPGIFRVGSTEIRRPGAFRYMDDVMNEDT